MKPRWFCLILVLLFNVLLFNSKIALAEVQSQYAVSDVAVNASGKTPSQARINAVAAGQRNAFVILLNRLGIDESVAASLQDDLIADMVASQQIIDEKISGNNYSATLNLTFSESFVKHYLGNKIGSSEVAKPNSYLVVPIKVVKNQSIIWEENNDWKLAWENITQNGKTPSIKFLKGDVEDISIFNFGTIINNSFSSFEPAFNKYKVDTLVFAYFEFDAIENKVNINLQIIRKSQTNQIRLDFVNVNQLSMPDLINKVAVKTLDYLVGDKNNTSSVASNGTASINIDVLISDLGDWITVKNKLENSNIASGLKVSSISKDLVKINVTYNNNNGDIINFFAKYNLFLQRKTEGGYFLSLTK